jgi:protein phosphatase
MDCIKQGLSASDALEQALAKAAVDVYEEGQSSLNLRGMGTTLSAMAIKDGRAYISHVGDSRIYCLREENLHQLTSDHSFVNEQIQAGIMSPDEARLSSLRNIITRAIGHNKNVIPDRFSIPVKSKDIFMLCTDGLNNMLLDQEIAHIVNNFSPDKAINNLIDASNKNGGDDNITVILIQTG